jgi:hypothetical protein
MATLYLQIKDLHFKYHTIAISLSSAVNMKRPPHLSPGAYPGSSPLSSETGLVPPSARRATALLAYPKLTFGETFGHLPKQSQVNLELKRRERPEVTIGSRPRRAVTLVPTMAVSELHSEAQKALVHKYPHTIQERGGLRVSPSPYSLLAFRSQGQCSLHYLFNVKGSDLSSTAPAHLPAHRTRGMVIPCWF